MLIHPTPLPCEGRLSFRLRSLEANLIPGSMAIILDEDPEFVDVQMDRRVPEDWIHRLCRWCPACLRSSDEGYGRIGWEIRFADACAACGCWLADVCAQCGEHVSWSRTSYMRCSCGALLADCDPHKAPPALEAMSRALELRAMGGCSDEMPMVNGLSLHQCIQLIRWLGTYGARTRQRGQQKLAATDTLDVSWPVTTYAAEMLSSWPRHFNVFLDGLQSGGQQDDDGSLLRTFRGFYRALYTTFGQKEFAWLREAFENYVVEQWSGSMGKRNRRMYERVAAKMAWIPTSLAAKLTSLSEAAFVRLARQRNMDVRTYTTATGRQFSKVARQSVVQLAPGGGEDTVTLTEAALVLGFKRSRLQALLPLICPEATKLQPTNVWMVPRKWLESMQKTILGLPVALEGVDGEWVTLDWLFRYEVPSNSAVARLLADVQGGRISAIRDGRSDLLSQVSFRRSDAKRVWLDCAPKSSSLITLMDAAERLRVKQEVVYALVRTGLLRTEVFKVGRRQCRGVNVADLGRFCAVYVFGRDLATDLNTSPRALSISLDRLGVGPVSGPDVDGCRQLVYRREDVAVCGVPILLTEASRGAP